MKLKSLFCFIGFKPERKRKKSPMGMNPTWHNNRIFLLLLAILQMSHCPLLCPFHSAPAPPQAFLTTLSVFMGYVYFSFEFFAALHIGWDIVGQTILNPAVFTQLVGMWHHPRLMLFLFSYLVSFLKNHTYVQKYLQLRFYFIHVRYNKCNLNVQILNKT